jgi:hypothetical protein
MESVQIAATEPPSPARGAEASGSLSSFPTRAYGYGTARYRAFLEALLDGLRLYESLQGTGRAHAQEPVPAA